MRTGTRSRSGMTRAQAWNATLACVEVVARAEARGEAQLEALVRRWAAEHAIPGHDAAGLGVLVLADHVVLADAREDSLLDCALVTRTGAQRFAIRKFANRAPAGAMFVAVSTDRDTEVYELTLGGSYR